MLHCLICRIHFLSETWFKRLSVSSDLITASGGTILHIKFTLPHDTVPIELTAEVVRSLQLGTHFEVEPGMGLRFVDIPEDVLLRIRNFVQWETMRDLEWKTDI